MEAVRKPFQGIINIIRFNWHFYLIAFVAISLLYFIAGFWMKNPLLANLVSAVVLLPVLISLLISYYVYDRSGLYALNWLTIDNSRPEHMINIHAGFDETSTILRKKFPLAHLSVFDFYDPAKHTEVSIKRARKAYPPYPSTIQINTEVIPLAAASV
jgi:hypothetical protein